MQGHNTVLASGTERLVLCAIECITAVRGCRLAFLLQASSAENKNEDHTQEVHHRSLPLDAMHISALKRTENNTAKTGDKKWQMTRDTS